MCRSSISHINYLRLVLIHRHSHIALLALVVFPLALRGQAPDTLAAARRIVAAASLAAQEYRLGVAPAGGSILLPGEVEEARLFVSQARFDVPLLPTSVRAAADSDFAILADQLDRLAPPVEVAARANGLIAQIAAALGGVVDAPPERAPSLAQGKHVYQAQCAECHGATGGGDGRKAATVEGPAPSALSDSELMGDVAAVDVFRRVSIGVPGTAMPEYEQTLSLDDRWAVTAYVLTLSGRPGLVHASSGVVAAEVFATVKRQVDSAVALRSERAAFDAYLTFERIETEVRTKAPGLAADLETSFAGLRAGVLAGDDEELRVVHQALLAGLEQAQRAVADRASGASLFAESLVLILREGFEAILIVGALMAFLTRAGAPRRRREVAVGAWSAVVASLATWGLVELVFSITPAQREALEGATLLLATAVLFYVSYWLLSKVEVRRWNAFVASRMQAALTAGSGLALAGVAFLAVYREGFETILFYKALLGSSGADGMGPVLGGIVVGAVLLVGVYVSISYFGLRLPLKPFFAATSAILYYMAFVFAGKGVAELQAAGVTGLTPVVWAPRVPLLGIYPTMESLLLQAALLVLAVVSLAWVTLRPAPPTPAASESESRRRGAAPVPQQPAATRQRSSISG